MRSAEIKRDTNETKITVSLNIDGTGKSNIDTGCGFLDHMLTLFAKHGRFDLDVKCDGDMEVDAHHTTEDCAIVIASAFEKALGDKKGIERYGSFILPMDEALVMVALDIGGRMYYDSDFNFPSPKVGDFDTELTDEFFISFARNLNMNLHIRQMAGKNSHHIIEAAFKGFGHALKTACKINPEYADEVLSTKGVL